MQAAAKVAAAATLILASTTFFAGDALAQTIAQRGILGDTAVMVCHESGGSGLPLTDYINNIDFATWDFTSLTYVSAPPHRTDHIELVFNTETSSSPTPCAIAIAELVGLEGYTVKQSFSHFTGYYVVILGR
jgi:hypothetical protein